jgi:hypothetical protein
MKSFKQTISEVAQPKPEEEKRFKAQHAYEIIPHPVALPHQHTGEIQNTADITQRPKAARPADQEGSANYDLAYESALDRVVSEALKGGQKKLDHNKNGKLDAHDFVLMRSKKMKEEAEELDEISKKTLGSYVKKASDDMADNAYTLGARDPLKKSGSWSKSFKRRKGIEKATDRLTKEEVALDEVSKDTLGRYATKALNRGDIANRMSKSDDDSMGKIATKRLAGVKKAVDKLADKTGKKALARSIKKDVDTTKASGNAYARGGGVDDHGKSYYKADRNIGKMREEAEELDEISKKTLGSYAKKAYSSASEKEATADREYKRSDEAPYRSRSSADHEKAGDTAAYKARDRRKNAGKAIDRLTKEEVEQSNESYAELSTLKSRIARNEKKMKSLPDLHPEKKKLTIALQKDKKTHGELFKNQFKEEVELDETTMSASKRPVNVTGRDGKTRTVYKRSNVAVKDDNGLDKIKTNESLAEAFSQGIVKLQDGSQVILKKQDADLLNQMFKDLSSNNRKKMQSAAMKDEVGFEEILGFAREAL